MKRLICIIITGVFLATACLADTQDTTVKRRSGPRRQLATIVFAGLGGAILGLSTLSFYGRPQEHLSNIAIGFAVGVIAGTAYVTFRTATTHDYDEESTPSSQSRAEPEDEPTVLYGPLLTRVSPQATAAGGQFAIRF